MPDRARTPSVQRANRRLLRELGLPRIPDDDLARRQRADDADLRPRRPRHEAPPCRTGRPPSPLEARRHRRRRPRRVRRPTGSDPHRAATSTPHITGDQQTRRRSRTTRRTAMDPALAAPTRCGSARAGDQPVLDSGRGTLANADSVNHRGTARRAAVVPCMFSTPERRAAAHSLSPRQISTMWGNVVVTVTVTG